MFFAVIFFFFPSMTESLFWNELLITSFKFRELAIPLVYCLDVVYLSLRISAHFTNASDAICPVAVAFYQPV